MGKLRDRRREMARRAYDRVHAEGNGDDQAAFEAAYREESDIAGIPPVLIIGGIKIAILLYKLWREKRLDRVPVDPIEGESEFDVVG